MTDLNLLRAVIENPHDDVHRLILADWLEENGDPERAEFIRTQIELSSLLVPHGKWEMGVEYVFVMSVQESYDGKAYHVRKSDKAIYDELRRRERELWSSIGVDLFNSSGLMFANHTVKQFTSGTGFNIRRIGGGSDEVHWSRGFISSITCSWQDWIIHAPALVWWPEANRPMPATVQPLELMRLTTWPSGVVDGFNADRTAWLADGYRFNRVKCSTCGGTGWGKPTTIRIYDGETVSQSRCESCHGQPLNEWTCEAWPTVRFRMPEVTSAPTPR
jgi:uncharacterized protein (TIGR02996 family)